MNRRLLSKNWERCQRRNIDVNGSGIKKLQHENMYTGLLKAELFKEMCMLVLD